MYLPNDLWLYIKKFISKNQYFNNYKLMFYYLKYKTLY
jgi:hypothetical protein